MTATKGRQEYQVSKAKIQKKKKEENISNGKWLLLFL